MILNKGTKNKNSSYLLELNYIWTASVFYDSYQKSILGIIICSYSLSRFKYLLCKL